MRGRRVLVVEDEYLLAADLAEALTAAGVEVVGPAAHVMEARALLNSSARVDAAVLDINLHGDVVFPLADALRRRGVPLLFVTGYDRSGLPDGFCDVPHLAKPVEGSAVIAALASLPRPGPFAPLE